MRILRIVSAVVVAATAGACASSGGAASGPGAVSSLSATPGAPASMSGSFITSASSASGVMSAGRAARIDGTVNVKAGGMTDNQWTVDFNFDSQRGAETLLWSIVEGRCGSASLPLVSPRQNTRIEVESSGRGRLRAELRATMTNGHNYHVNLYQNEGTDLADVVACANLK